MNYRFGFHSKAGMKDVQQFLNYLIDRTLLLVVLFVAVQKIDLQNVQINVSIDMHAVWPLFLFSLIRSRYRKHMGTIGW